MRRACTKSLALLCSGGIMGESLHRLGHFVGTDLYRKPPLLRYSFSWKHLQDPADYGRLEEFNEAVRRLESDHRRMDNSAASHGVERKMKAAKLLCHELPPENVGQVASVAVIAQSKIAVDANVGVGGGDGPEKKARFRRVTFLCGKGPDAENGRERASPEKTDGRAGGGDVGASACERISNDDIRSPSISASADVVFGDGNQTDPAIIERHNQVSAPGSSEVCPGDEETGPSSSPETCHELPAVAQENMEQFASAVAESEIDADVGGGGGQKKKARFHRVTFVCRKGRDAENGGERAQHEKTDGRAGDMGAYTISDDDIRSPSISTPADVVLGEGSQTDPAIGEHHQVSALGSGKVSAGDEENGPSSSPEYPVDLTPSPRAEAAEALEHSPACADDARTEGDLTSPLEAYLQIPAPTSVDDVVGAGDQDSVPSSPNLSDDTVPSRAPSPSPAADNTGGGGVDLHRLGERIAMEMDEDAIRSEVARQFGADRQRRAARRRAVVAVAPRVHFSLRLSHEEAMEDVAAVAVPEDVQPDGLAGHGTRKRRRGG